MIFETINNSMDSQTVEKPFEKGDPHLEDLTYLEKLIGNEQIITQYYSLKKDNMDFFKDLGKIISKETRFRMQFDRENIHH